MRPTPGHLDASRRRIGDIAVPHSPQAVALSADGRLASTSDHDAFSVIDLRTAEVTATLHVAAGPRSVAPDGRTAYVTAGAGGGVSVVALS